MALASRTECRYVEVIVDKRHDLRETVHSGECPREDLEKQAESIEISVHEWPLPTNRFRAKSTVFELQVPEPFGSWRDTTLFFLHSCLNLRYAVEQRPRAEYRPDTYQGLSSFFRNNGRNQRICLLSQDKPHERTHRRDRLIVSVTENDICVSNGLHFQYFDNALGCFVGGFERSHQTEKSCTYMLPAPSSALQQFLFRPAKDPHGPTPNTVIATQSDAPDGISLEEYKALAIMPLGLEIQCQNILLELAMPSVDMKKAETTIFMLQIINQAGPSKAGTAMRQGHAILSQDAFTIKLLCQIQEAMERVKENWESICGLHGLIRLALRIFSLSPSDNVCESCVECLNSLRQTAFRWVNLVREKATRLQDDARKTSLVAKSVHIALVCVETFNAETIMPMFAHSVDVSIFLRCCSIIWNGRNSLTVEAGSLLQILYHRWQNPSYRSHAFLAESIVQHTSPGLDLAIKATWAAYDVGSTWSTVSTDMIYWLRTHFETQNRPGEDMMVHYNLLTGELLVDGLPLARLPSRYECHPTYQKLFGKSQLDVMPSSLPGMQFSCQNQYSSHTVHLGEETMPGSTDFEPSVRAMKDGEVWQLVPSRLFAGVFPDEFVENHIHWYSALENMVEFRPLQTPWLSSSQNWQLRKSPCQTAWSLKRQGLTLISAVCQTAKVIRDVFQPIEKTSKLHCIYHKASSNLHIELPRLRLEFFLNPQSSKIQSRQYPGMSIASNQIFGTLIGLRNALLLTKHDPKDQVILIPEGAVSCARDGHHVRVDIRWQAMTKVHAYVVDHQLGRLLDNGSLQSKLFLAFLHALTSFCIPDPLTKKTGTEQALSMLRSASLRSFDCLRAEQLELLKSIASLTPSRGFYPDNERVMQSISWWPGLGCLSQHYGFREEVAHILDQDRRMRIFYPGTEPAYPELPRVDRTLCLRERIRTSSFRTTGFGAEDHTETNDITYHDLDQNRISPEGIRSFSVSKMLYDGIPSVRKTQPQQLASHLWEFLSLPTGVHGPHSPLEIKRLRYDAEWILESRKFLVSNWCSILRFACSQNPCPNKFQFTTWLATVAFSSDAYMAALETIISFFVIPELNSTHPPTSKRFSTMQGAGFISTAIRHEILSEQLHVTPESNLKPNKDKNAQRFKSRKARLRSKNRKAALEDMLHHSESQWPTRSPTSPSNRRIYDYLNVQRIMIQISKLFNEWYDNRELKQYISDIANVICHQLVEEVEVQPYLPPQPSQSAPVKRGFITFDEMLHPHPTIVIEEPRLETVCSPSFSSKLPPSKFPAFLNSLSLQAKSNYEKKYVEQLEDSFLSLQNMRQDDSIDLAHECLKNIILKYLASCHVYADRVYRALVSQLLPFEKTSESGVETRFRRRIAAMALELRQYPRFSPVLFLEQLSRHRWGSLDTDWKECFIAYGCLITKLQRAKRLAGLLNDRDELLKEIRNPGHTNWQPIRFPESLLLEIENDILVRENQEEIAATMRHTVPGQNSVMQLNMGEGKSSVIVPMVVTYLANGSCLVRVLVAKPQSR